MHRLARFFAAVTVVLAGAVSSVAFAVPASAADEGPEFREIHFPVEGAVSFTDDFGAPRSGHTHEGNDLMGTKMQKLLAATDGTLSVRLDPGNTTGHMLTIRDSEGWSYRYIHVNNDNPGTDDNAATTENILAPGIESGMKVKAGQFIAFMGDSGNAESTAPHLHFEVRSPDGTAVDPWTSLRLSKGLPAGTRCSYGTNPKPVPTKASGAGYYVLGNDGGIFTFGDAGFYGSVPGLGLGARVTALRLLSTKSGQGYFILGADGGIFTFGDAEFAGSVPGLGLNRVKALDLQRTTTGKGYWVLGDDGGVFSFGDAGFYGSVPGLGISTKAIRLVPTPTGEGYWVLAADGGVFSFGDADFHGSVPGLGIASKVVAMSAPPLVNKKDAAKPGYWLLAADGGVFSFDAPFYGSVPGSGMCKWPTGVQMTPTATGKGYWVVGNDGSVWSFGDAARYSDVTALGLKITAVDMAAIPAASSR
jgi:hypothetical protein